MAINVKQLQVNVNLHCFRQGSLNNELCYVIASGEENFRFVEWNQLPADHEQKLYCFLMDKPLSIPAANITLHKSYVLNDAPVYPVLTAYTDFVAIIDNLGSSGVAKCVKQFSNEDIDTIKLNLQDKYGNVQKHVVTSNEAQHLLLVLQYAEISISSAMVYFRPKAPFSEDHYHDAAERT